VFCLRVFSWIAEEYRQEECHADEHGVEEVRDDGDGVEGGESCRDEHLCAIREKSLGEAGGGVEDGR